MLNIQRRSSIAKLAGFVDFIAADAKVCGSCRCVVSANGGSRLPCNFTPILRIVIFFGQPHFSKGVGLGAVNISYQAGMGLLDLEHAPRGRHPGACGHGNGRGAKAAGWQGSVCLGVRRATAGLRGASGRWIWSQVPRGSLLSDRRAGRKRRRGPCRAGVCRA